jgi:hypothetical protein
LSDALFEELRRLAQSRLAGPFERTGPPRQLIEHLAGSLIEMIKLA